MIAKNGNSSTRWYLPAAPLVLLAVMGLTISATLAAVPSGPPVDKGTTGVADPSSADQPNPDKIAGCIPDRDYTYITSTNASLIPGTTLVSGSQTDDGITPLALPFPISFYGVVTRSVNLGTNGNLQLTSSNVAQINVCLPTTSMNNLISPFWDDIDMRTSANASCPGGTCGVFTALTGVAGSRIFTIEWRGVLFGTTTPVDFEVNLYENDPNNRIDFVYGQTGNGGLGATVGIQKGTGTKYTHVSCNTANLANGEQITLQQIPCGAATFTPTNTVAPTYTNTRTPTNTITSTSTATNTPPTCGPGAAYVVMTSTNASFIPGITDIGNHGDDAGTVITLPFTFRLYSQPFAQATVTSNGVLEFSSASASFSNSCLPTTTFNNAIFPYWDDMRTDGTTGEGIFTSVTGSMPNRIFAVEWRACIRTGATVCSAIDTNFEVLLYETPLPDGTEFSLVYGQMLQNGSSATVGVQRGTGSGGSSAYTQYSCNTANLSPSLKIDFKPFPCGAPTSTPTRTPTATATPCGAQRFTGSITNTDPTEAGRVTRNLTSTCGTTATCPGLNDSTLHHYDAYTFTNSTGQSRCVTVGFTGTCSGTDLTSEAYIEPLDPNGPCTNWVAQSSTFGTTGSYSFDVQAGASFTIVLVEVTTGSNGCSTYTMTVSGLDLTCPTNTATPTYSPTNTTAPTNTFTPTISLTPTMSATPIATCGPGAHYLYTVANGMITPGTTDTGNHCDDCSTTLTLPFTFRFYGQNYSTANVNANGALQFVSNSTSFSNVCLPSTSFNWAMFPYWDDLRTDGTGGTGIFTSTGTDPSTGGQVLNIEWRTCVRLSAATCIAIDTNFEVRLLAIPRSDGTEYEFVYGNVTGNGADHTQGSSATIGVQAGTGRDYTEYECNTLGSVQNGLLLRWAPFGCGSPTLTTSPTRTISPTNTATSTSTATGTSTPTFTPRATTTCGPDANYTIITSTGASLVPGTTDIGNHTDDGTTFITLPFTFNFYGIEYGTARASSNGNLQFVSNNTSFSNVCLPTTTFNNAMFPYWDDLRTDILTGTLQGGIFTTEEGPPGDRIFDIEWRAAYFRAITETVNFEIRLYENPGTGNISRFDYVYQEDPEGGSSATVGAQRDTGSLFVQYECLTGGSISPGLQITFTQAACGTGTPLPTATPACTPYAVGHLTWQTVPQPNTRSAQPVTVTIKSGVNEVNLSTTTDASGFFTVPLGTSFPSGGTASWRVKGPRHLANCGVFTIVSGCSQSNFEAGTQRGGDANPTTGGNNVVNSTDFNTLKGVFGQNCTCSSDADFTGNVSASDFNILKGNFGQAGCGPIFGPDSTK